MRLSILGIVALGCLPLATPVGAQVFEVDDLALTAAQPESYSRFGRAVAVGDFDGDGLDDLAVGSPYATVAPLLDNGRVDVFLAGGERGFLPPIAVDLALGTDCRIGWALAAGNFDGAGADELAIGAPGCAGGIVLVRNAGGGVTQWWQSLVSPDPSEEGDEFGAALAVGDFDGDGFDDLAVGVPEESLGVDAEAGAVHVVYGSASGLTAAGAATVVADDLEPGISGDYDRFGLTLAAGDFDADLFSDLAIAAPGRTVAAASGAGQLHVAFGSAAGIQTVRRQLFDDVSFGFAVESGDGFGRALAAGNFDGAGGVACPAASPLCADDLAIGKPGEDLGALQEAGHVIVAFGQLTTGLATIGALALHQGDLGYSVEAYDRFGEALAAGRQDSRRFADTQRWAADLVVGVPAESYTENEEGVAHLVFGSNLGLSPAGSQLVARQAGWASWPPALEDYFAWAIAIGDFDGDAVGDLAAGIPGRYVASLPDAGAVQVLFGALFADGLERASAGGWSAVVP